MPKHADERSVWHLRSNIQANSSKLCLSCGLCCLSAIYPRSSLLYTETEFADSLGLTVVTLEEHLYFCLPCPLYQQNRCSIYYATRPAVCVDFRCSLLKKFQNEQISLEQSLRLVKYAKELWTEVTMQLPTGYSFTRFRLLFEQASTAKTGLNSLPDVLRNNSSLLRAMFRLEWYLLKHFHLARESSTKK
jgi:hypothetical protein